jgi:membrane associated rhomboid family serine protease
VGLVMPFRINSFGVTPRSLVGLVGIPLMPFLHADLKHLMSNTFPLTVLLLLLAGSKAKSWAIVTYIILLGGAMLWLFGRSVTHVGASGLIYGLIAFLLVSGLLERRIVPLVIAVVVGFLYGGTLLSGIVPSLRSHISWEGHLFSAVAGGLVAGLLTKQSKQPEAESG